MECTLVSDPHLIEHVISFTSVRAPYGWLGNMSPHPISAEDAIWSTAEALFQALRFAPSHPARDLIRAERSPMAAKMVAKHRESEMAVKPQSTEDLDLMRRVIRLKITQHPTLKKQLLATESVRLIEDVSRRWNKGSAMFWGARQTDRGWLGRNWLGCLWMELREDLQKSNPPAPCDPVDACETHGRCWTHSEWARCSCGEIVDGLDGLCGHCRARLP